MVVFPPPKEIWPVPAIVPETVFVGPSISRLLPATAVTRPVLAKFAFTKLVTLLVAVISSVPALLNSETGALPLLMAIPPISTSNTPPA